MLFRFYGEDITRNDIFESKFPILASMTDEQPEKSGAYTLLGDTSTENPFAKVHNANPEKK